MEFDLDGLLRQTTSRGASDLHLKLAVRPRIRVDGELTELAQWRPFTPPDAASVIAQLGRNGQLGRLEREGSADLSYALDGTRFRVTAFRQQSAPSFVFRVIGEPPDARTLGLPEVVCSWADHHRGLVVVTGPTGSGKSTTVAALLRLINERRCCHIVTIEDPVEFVHRDRRALVSQREIGIDAPSYTHALRAVLRQDPDVVLIGEVRDEESAMTALRAAETGHLVFCTMHTIDAAETVTRFIDLFSGQRMHELGRRMLSATLIGIISQRLVPGSDGGRRLNAEVLVNSALIADLIANGAEGSKLEHAIAEGGYYGMRTFDQCLVAQIRAGAIDEQVAVNVATRPHDLRLALSGAHERTVPVGQR